MRALLRLCTSDSPIQLCSKLLIALLRADTSALVVVGDHDRLGRPSADNPTDMVKHREMEVESYLLAMMSAVARYAQRKDDRS